MIPRGATGGGEERGEERKAGDEGNCYGQLASFSLETSAGQPRSRLSCPVQRAKEPGVFIFRLASVCLRLFLGL